jgi:hypothetical protein
MHEHRSGPVIALVLALPLLFVGLYMGVYYANLAEASFMYGVGINDDAGAPLEYKPVYRVDRAWLRTLLQPANQIDRALRPGYWER